MKQVKDSGEPMDLKPMNAADRRTVHKLAQEWGLVSESEGDGPTRHIVLKPGDSAPSDSAARDETDANPEDAAEKTEG